MVVLAALAVVGEVEVEVVMVDDVLCGQLMGICSGEQEYGGSHCIGS